MTEKTLHTLGFSLYVWFIGIFISCICLPHSIVLLSFGFIHFLSLFLRFHFVRYTICFFSSYFANIFVNVLVFFSKCPIKLGESGFTLLQTLEIQRKMYNYPGNTSRYSFSSKLMGAMECQNFDCGIAWIFAPFF